MINWLVLPFISSIEIQKLLLVSLTLLIMFTVNDSRQCCNFCLTHHGSENSGGKSAHFHSFFSNILRFHLVSFPVMICFSVAVLNTTTKSNLGRRGFISCYSSQLTVRKSGQELKQSPWRSAVDWLASLWSAWLPFLHSSGLPAQGWPYPQWDGPAYVS